MTDDRVALLGRRLRRLKANRELFACLAGGIGLVAAAAGVRSLGIGGDIFSFLGCLAAMFVAWWTCYRMVGVLVSRCDAALIDAIRDASMPKARVVTRRE